MGHHKKDDADQETSNDQIFEIDDDVLQNVEGGARSGNQFLGNGIASGGASAPAANSDPDQEDTDGDMYTLFGGVVADSIPSIKPRR